MKWTVAAFLVSVLCSLPAAGATSAAEIAAELRTAELDPQECYRVREVHFTRDDLRFYFTDGWVVFGKPIAGRIISAVFVVDSDIGDAELLVMPPTVGERMALASFTKAPNLNEHFVAALMLFTDDTASALKQAIERRGEPQKGPERGLLLADSWNRTVVNLSTSFSTRMVQHILSDNPPERGFFYAGIQGKALGNFDALYDPSNVESIYLGQLKYTGDRAFYDTWVSFPARSRRERRRQLDFAVSKYRIEAVMDETLGLKAVTQLTVTPNLLPTRVLAFDLSARMQVTSVRINGEEAEVFTRESLRSDLIRAAGSMLFLVVAPQPLEPGRHYEVVVEHEGNVVSHAGEGVYYVGGRGNWYPRYGMEFAAYDITFTYPSRLQLLFPGEIREDRTEEGQRTTRRVTPVPIRLAGFNLGDYESAKATRGNLAVEVYANRKVETALAPKQQIVMLPPPAPMGRRPPGTVRADILALPPPKPPDPTGRLSTLASDIASGFEFLASHFGPPALPTLMVSPIPGTFGQGFPGLVYISTLTYLNPQDRPASARQSQNELFFSDLLHIHETAHQWWGNVVFPASTQDEWLMEGLANYSSLLYFEKNKGIRAMNSVLEEYKEQLLEKNDSDRELEAAGPIRLGPRLQSSLSPGAWRSIIYGKGTWIVHMLRRRLGDESFFKLLGEVCRRYRFQEITVAQFQELAATYLPKGSSDPKLEYFFEHWVESTGIPHITMTTSVKGKAPRVALTIAVKHAGIGDKASISVPVQVQLARGRAHTHWILSGPDPVSLTLNLAAPPAKVTLDPENAVLRR